MAFVAPRAGPRAAVSEVAEVGLKAFAVLAKRTPFDASKPASQKAILGAVQKVNEFLGELEALELYSDWVPSRAEPVIAVAFAPDSAFASSKKNDDNAAGKVFVDDASWTSSSGKNHHWGAKFASRSAVCSVSVAFKKDSMPDKVEVQIDEATSGSKEEYRTVAEFKGKEVTERLTATVKGASVSGRALKLVFTGLAGDNNNNCVVVSKVSAQAVRPRESYSSSSEALSLLQGWFDSIATASSSAPTPALDATEAAAAGLLHIARSTGSLNALLKATTHLLSGPQRALSPSTAAIGSRLLAIIREKVAAERLLQNDAEYSAGWGSSSSGGGGSSAAYGEVEGARFDPGSSSSSMFTWSNDNLTCYGSGYDNCYAVLNIGPFTEGTASWSFKLDEDTTSQCSCFGAVIKPVSSANYEYSSEMLMYRSFNGNAYNRGSCCRYGSGEADKVKKGDTIRFDLDFGEADGVMKVTINDSPKGVIFNNLKGLELWPAISYYSSGRQVTLVSVECAASVAKACGLSIKGPGKVAAQAGGASSSGAPSSAPNPVTGCALGLVSTLSLQDLPEEQAVVGKGAVGKRGDMGWGEGDERKVKVGGKAATSGIAMHPPAATTAAADASATTGGGGAAGGSASDASDSKSPESSFASASATDSKEEATTTATASTPSGEGEGEGGDARKARLIAAACKQTADLFKGAASCLYWLGGGYERLTGSVALADSATADVRGGADASPVFFEVYGDGARLLWRSNPFHAAKSPAQAFDVRVMGAQTLRLVVRCVGGNAGAHAVWVDPQLTTATDWAAGGWRNDRHAFVDALTGAPRGGEAPVPLPHQTTPPLVAPGATATPASASAWLSTSHGLAAGLLVYTGLLAQEYTRGMRRPLPTSGDVSSVDVEAPFALEPCPAAVAAMGQLMARLAGGEYAAANGTATTGSPCLDTPALAAACAALVRTAAANLRRVVVAGISPVAVGLATDKAGSSDKKGGDKAGKGITLGAAVTNAVAALARLSLWGGKATGHPVADGAPASTGAGGAGASAPLQPVAASAVVQDAVWDFADLVRGLTAMDDSHAQARTAFLRSLCGGRGGVVEVQTSWPCEEYDGDGALVGVESALLATQLAAQAAGWRVRLMGVWPAKAWLVIDVPGPSTAAAGDDSAAASGGDLADFVEGTLGDVFAQTDLGEWWAAGASDALALKLERSPVWDRRARLAFEPGVGAVRVYPSYVATFDEVVQGIRDFLPPATTATKA